MLNPLLPGLEDADRAIPGDALCRLRAIAHRLADLHAQFDENVLDATAAWSKHVVDETKLTGMTRQAKDAARRSARDYGLDGFRLMLRSPAYESAMRHVNDRELRRELYEAHTTLASDRGPTAGRFDNGPLIDEILALRHERAQLLGFSSYADALARRRLAASAEDAERFLLELNARLRPRAQAELDEIWTLAKSRDAIKGFRPWDLPYYAQQQLELRRGFSEEELSSYFSAPLVLEGLSALTTRLCGIRIEPAPDVPVWHPDVTVLRLRGTGEPGVVLFYLDLYPREPKRGGAWIAGDAAGGQAARVFVTCNLAPSSPGQPALWSQHEVDTLVGQWGRVLHYVVTGAAIPDGSIVVPEDTLAPTESFARRVRGAFYDGLADFARHVRLGEPMPAAMLEHLTRRRAPRPALAILREIELALFDLRIHRDYIPALRASRLRSQVLDTFAQARREVCLLPPPPWNRRACSFQEAFGESRGGGYYLRKWIELREETKLGAV